MLGSRRMMEKAVAMRRGVLVYGETDGLRMSEVRGGVCESPPRRSARWGEGAGRRGAKECARLEREEIFDRACSRARAGTLRRMILMGFFELRCLSGTNVGAGRRDFPT